MFIKALQYAMRRAGQNPTDIEVQDLLNKIDDGSGTLNVDDFLVVMRESSRDIDGEIHFKDAFRAFSKDKDGALFYFPYSYFFSFFSSSNNTGRAPST